MINGFIGEYFFLSNFYMSPIEYEGVMYANNEAAFQASKTLDLEQRKSFATLKPGDAKRKGRKLILRSDWEDIKYSVMYDICKLKFDSNSEIRQMLINTGTNEIVEINTWHDNIWGQCNCSNCKDLEHKNWLGKILMELRSNYISRGEV